MIDMASNVARKIDTLLKEKAEITLKSGEKVVGYGDCQLYLPINDDSEEEDEFLCFITNDNEKLFLLDEDIQNYQIM